MNNTVAKMLFDHMSQHFQEYAQAASATETPNAEDSDVVKCGIIGFSVHSEPAKWTRDEYEFLQGRIDTAQEHLSDDKLKLAAMCIGGLCGLHQEDKIDKEAFANAQAQLPVYFLETGGGCDSDGCG